MFLAGCALLNNVYIFTSRNVEFVEKNVMVMSSSRCWLTAVSYGGKVCQNKLKAGVTLMPFLSK